MAFAARNDQIAGARQTDGKADGFAAVGDAIKALAFTPALAFSPGAISPKIPSSDSVRGSSAVRTEMSAS